MKIGHFSVNNPVLINIIMFALLVMGAITLSRIPRELFAEVPFYFVVIQVPWPGVSAREVEQQLTIPIEDEMQGLDDLDSVTSFSSEGISIVSIRFNDGISRNRFDKLTIDVNTRFSRVSLPDDTVDPSVSTFSSNDFAPVIEIILSGNVGYEELVKTAKMLESPLLRISEVDDIDLIGIRDRQIVLSTDRAALESREISLNEMLQAIKSRNVNVPGGTLKTNTRNYLVRTMGEIDEIEDFGEVVIRRTAEINGSVRVRDVAEVMDEYDPDGSQVRFDGDTAIMLRVIKVPSGGSIRIIESVKEVMNDWNDRIPNDIKVNYLNDSSVYIQTNMRILLTNALIGLVFLIVILFIFVGFRNALITALGIPVTFAITLIILELTGQTFNTNTLFGMILVLGLVVDHAIVIIENSFRFRQLNLNRHDAAIRGTNQVAIPVIAATATTVAAFLPLMILPGVMGKFLRVIPFTVTIALVASTAEALLFLPSHYADWPEGRKTKLEGKIFKRFRSRFRRLSARTYKWKKLTVLLTILFMFASFGLIPLLQQDLFSDEDIARFYIDCTMSPGTPIHKTNQVISRFEDKLLPLVGNGEVTAITTSVGFMAGETGNSEGASVAQISVFLVEKDQGRERSVSTILAEVEKLTSNILGTDKVLYRKVNNGPPTDPPVSFRIFGNSYDDLLIVADRIRSELAADDDIFNIQDNYELGSQELVIQVNEERATSFGLSVSSVGQYIRSSVEEIKATTFFKDNETIDVIVRFSDAGSFDPSFLSQSKIISPTGKAVPLSAVAKVISGDSLASIKRFDGRREITVTADAYSKRNVPSINERIKDIWTEEYSSRYPDVEITVGGEFAEFNNLLIKIARLFLVGIFLIYIILGAQFRSYLQPFLIMFSVPLALSGVVIYLTATGTLFSIPVLYAGVALAGIAVNDAIVLISFINEKRREGLSIKDAVLDAAETRFRPILLTSLTTIAGLAPTAFGIGGKSISWGPMAGTIVFGLIFSTLATLVFIPAFYGMLFDRSSKKEVKPVETAT